ncbi:hypothetical protein Q3G72_025822 [Acer saccharum]|nr:hypothetical protein Q3G72_025822 [Acer saccharum]
MIVEGILRTRRIREKDEDGEAEEALRCFRGMKQPSPSDCHSNSSNQTETHDDYAGSLPLYSTFPDGMEQPIISDLHPHSPSYSTVPVADDHAFGDVEVKKEQEENNTPSEYMTLRLKEEDHNELVFMVRKATPLKKLMDTYCVRKNMELNTFVFLFNGCHLRPEQTPDEAGLGNGDEIDTFQHQLGD